MIQQIKYPLILTLVSTVESANITTKDVCSMSGAPLVTLSRDQNDIIETNTGNVLDTVSDLIAYLVPQLPADHQGMLNILLGTEVQALDTPMQELLHNSQPILVVQLGWYQGMIEYVKANTVRIMRVLRDQVIFRREPGRYADFVHQEVPNQDDVLIYEGFCITRSSNFRQYRHDKQILAGVVALLKDFHENELSLKLVLSALVQKLSSLCQKVQELRAGRRMEDRYDLAAPGQALLCLEAIEKLNQVCEQQDYRGITMHSNAYYYDEECRERHYLDPYGLFIRINSVPENITVCLSPYTDIHQNRRVQFTISGGVPLILTTTNDVCELEQLNSLLDGGHLSSRSSELRQGLIHALTHNG